MKNKKQYTAPTTAQTVMLAFNHCLAGSPIASQKVTRMSNSDSREADSHYWDDDYDEE